MASMTDIPFPRIPLQSELFLKYLECSPSALRFYQQPPRFEELLHFIQTRLNAAAFPRTDIASILRRQNISYGNGAETLNCIDQFEHADCVAVLTGQQVGLFTGPLYTVYKALTAIRLAEALKKSGIRAVPIFWMETEDHDLAEVSRRTVLNPDASLENIDFRDTFFAEPQAGSVGSIPFPERMRQDVQEYLKHLPDGPARPEISAAIQEACRPGTTLAQSFAELLSLIFAGRGLILFDPHDLEVKRLSSKVYQTALREHDAFRAGLLRRNRDLEDSGFHAQVHVLENSTVLFFNENGERRALEKMGQGFGLKNAGRTFTLDELLEHAARTPEKFSPNVLLRPLIQDHLFPTAAYVGGSAELAYFAQIGVLYEMYNRPMPVLWPRDSLTLIEAEIGAEMDRLGTDLADFFQGRDHLIQKAVDASSYARAVGNIGSMQERLERDLTDLKPDLQAIEPPLVQALETARSKMLHNIRRLKSQLVRLEGTGNPSIATSIDRMLNSCYPNSSLQERELGVFHFLARHGFSLLDEIWSVVETGNFEHHVLRLKD
jgi:bacillithiol synthase